MSEELLTVSEVAKALRVDSTTIIRWIKGGVLEAIPMPKVGGKQRYRIRRTELDRVLSTVASTC